MKDGQTTSEMASAVEDFLSALFEMTKPYPAGLRKTATEVAGPRSRATTQ